MDSDTKVYCDSTLGHNYDMSWLYHNFIKYCYSVLHDTSTRHCCYMAESFKVTAGTVINTDFYDVIPG